MSEPVLAALASVSPERFVRLSGLPFGDDPTDWHVNKNIMVAGSSDPLTTLLTSFMGEYKLEGDGDDASHGLVFQRADASEEWLMLVLDNTDDEWSLNHAARMVGVHGSIDEYDIENFDLELIAVADNHAALDNNE